MDHGAPGMITVVEAPGTPVRHSPRCCLNGVLLVKGYGIRVRLAPGMGHGGAVSLVDMSHLEKRPGDEFKIENRVKIPKANLSRKTLSYLVLGETRNCLHLSWELKTFWCTSLQKSCASYSGYFVSCPQLIHLGVAKGQFLEFVRLNGWHSSAQSPLSTIRLFVSV